jgi:hypothetical protein
VELHWFKKWNEPSSRTVKLNVEGEKNIEGEKRYFSRRRYVPTIQLVAIFTILVSLL